MRWIMCQHKIMKLFCAMALCGICFGASGLQKYGNETVGQILSYGAVELNGTTVLGELNASGNVIAKNATIGSITANGQVSLHNCTVKGPSNINGHITARETVFQGDISVCSENLEFRNCTLQGIFIRQLSDPSKGQVLDLRGTNTVNGEIEFEAENGKVLTTYQKTNIYGDVVGARIEEK
jgi:hypothetical protein